MLRVRPDVHVMALSATHSIAAYQTVAVDFHCTYYLIHAVFIIVMINMVQPAMKAWSFCCDIFNPRKVPKKKKPNTICYISYRRLQFGQNQSTLAVVLSVLMVAALIVVKLLLVLGAGCVLQVRLNVWRDLLTGFFTSISGWL